MFHLPRGLHPQTHKAIGFGAGIVSVVAATITLLGIGIANPKPAAAQVRHADADFESAGYVTPAGMVPPAMYQGSVQPVAAFQDPGGYPGYAPPVEHSYIDNEYGYGAYGPYDSCPGCDEGYGCNSCACDSCACDSMGGCDSSESSGLLGCLSRRCGYKCCLGRPCNLSKLCLFCRGSGCSACKSVGDGQVLSALSYLLPYSKAGLCAQRWYDLSFEVLSMTHENSGATGALTSLGVGGPIVLSLQDVDAGGTGQAGVRLSGALIWGPGGNVEATYIGGPEWDATASVSDENAGLFSIISDFGNEPDNGFDDTDRSLLQSIRETSRFHSVELNYRRRTVGPYCRFQGSWLVGLRYLRYDDALIYSTLGELDNTVNADLPRFFSSTDGTKNNLLGPQAGFDFWWNIVPGVSAGFGSKIGWMQNDIDRRITLTANSLDPLATPGTVSISDGQQRGTVMGELEAKLVYRICYSCSLRTAYYAIGVNNVAFGDLDEENIRNFVQVNPLQQQDFLLNSIVIQGVSLGVEYIW